MATMTRRPEVERWQWWCIGGRTPWFDFEFWPLVWRRPDKCVLSYCDGWYFGPFVVREITNYEPWRREEK